MSGTGTIKLNSPRDHNIQNIILSMIFGDKLITSVWSSGQLSHRIMEETKMVNLQIGTCIEIKI